MIRLVRSGLASEIALRHEAAKHCTDENSPQLGCIFCAVWVGLILAAALLAPRALPAQVITIDTSGKGPVAATGPVDRRYAQIEPTKVELPKQELDAKTRLELIRQMESEQGFAMRPLPRGHKGLILEANGNLEPAGEAYLNMAVSEGICAKPGDRLVVTDIKIEKSKVVFELNGGPDFKHRFLRHVEIGAGDPNYSNPVVADEPDPTGARLTLAFKNYVPELTDKQLKALLAPMISFDVKTPIQAFTDTLPIELRDAILNHQVWVGMSTDMVLFAKGQPESKTREMDGQMPFEEWIYGKPPQDVDFVRINGNRVIRVEIAKIGQPLEVFTQDRVSGLMRSDGTPVLAANTRTVEEGDVEKDPNKQAPDAPPSLKNPGETLPDQDHSYGEMKPVRFPKQPDDQSGQQSGQQAGQQSAQQPGQNPDDQQPAPAQSGSSSGTANSSGGAQPASNGQAAPAGQSTPSSSASKPAQPAQPNPGTNQPGTNPDQFVQTAGAN
jgi:hypothetical protein